MAIRTRTRGQIIVGASPRVSLLPPAQRAELRHEKVMPKLLLTVVVSAVVAALIAGGGFAVATLAQQRLTAIDAESADLVTQLAAYGDTQELMNLSSQLTTMRQEAIIGEVRVIDVQDEISRGLPEGATLIGFAATMGASDPAATENTSLCGPGAATFTVTIRSPRFTDAADLLDTLSDVTGYQCAMVTSSTSEGASGAEPAEGESPTAATVTTIISLTVGEEALSARFAAKEAN